MFLLETALLMEEVPSTSAIWERLNALLMLQQSLLPHYTKDPSENRGTRSSIILSKG